MKFTEWLEERSDNNKYNKDILTRLARYVRPFFKDIKVTNWCRNENQRGWLEGLVDDGLSVSTIEACRNAGNMYLRYCSELSDGKLQYNNIRLTLPSLTAKRKYKIETERKLKMKKVDVVRMEGQYIKDLDFVIMMENSEGYLRSLIWLSYHYGLRLAECLAILPENYRKDYLLVKEQAHSKTENKYLKGVLERKVPHFNLTIEKQKETFEILKTIPDNRVNPTTVSRDFRNLTKRLKMNYRFHDLRGTWITNLSLEGINNELIRQAAGHRDMSTTQRYLRDPHVSEMGDRAFGE